MRRLVLVLAIITLVAGISVQAQKKSIGPRIQPPIWETAMVTMQDDNGGGYLVFDPMTGDYKCNLCEYGYLLEGKGEVKIDGCNIYFSEVEQGYRIFASVNMCDHQAKCAIEVFSLPKVGFDIEPIKEDWSDADMRDSKADCVTFQK